jgi:hypothetical protein
MWCATFVSAVGIGLGLTDIMLPECSCPQMINLYNKVGRFVEDDAYVPKIADIVMYDWGDSGKGDNIGTADHVGIVAAISGSSMTIIEGNLNNSVKTRKLSVNGRYIRGYCIPDYASKADAAPPVVPNATYTVTATGRFDSEATAKEALEYIKGMGFTGTISKQEAVAPSGEIKKGDTVRVKQGAKFYDGQTPVDIVYKRNHTVHSISGNRVVIAVGNVIVGPVHKDNLTVV